MRTQIHFNTSDYSYLWSAGFFILPMEGDFREMHAHLFGDARAIALPTF
jgi:hypothetical protein